jgi:hypothetical protein
MDPLDNLTGSVPGPSPFDPLAVNAVDDPYTAHAAARAAAAIEKHEEEEVALPPRARHHYQHHHHNEIKHQEYGEHDDSRKPAPPQEAAAHDGERAAAGGGSGRGIENSTSKRPAAEEEHTITIDGMADDTAEENIDIIDDGPATKKQATEGEAGRPTAAKVSYYFQVLFYNLSISTCHLCSLLSTLLIKIMFVSKLKLFCFLQFYAFLTIIHYRLRALCRAARNYGPRVGIARGTSRTGTLPSEDLPLITNGASAWSKVVRGSVRREITATDTAKMSPPRSETGLTPSLRPLPA